MPTSLQPSHVLFSPRPCPSPPDSYVISDQLTTENYASMYKSADCYVIPTRGEGWGMPITEV